ncbi:hypothetical protein [Streptomyces mirabilis]|uniref:hypothetical protein n=1 Tax=Streptomyces mirabilis TaxID=68239 RepID=UPI0036D83AA0
MPSTVSLVTPGVIGLLPAPAGMFPRVDGVLRRSGIVISIREGSTVIYALAGGDVAELLRAARRILTELLDGQNVLLTELQQADASAPPLPTNNRG